MWNRVHIYATVLSSGGLVGLVEVSDEIERHLENIQVGLFSLQMSRIDNVVN
jgi:hypothetical protein